MTVSDFSEFYKPYGLLETEGSSKLKISPSAKYDVWEYELAPGLALAATYSVRCGRMYRLLLMLLAPLCWP